MIRFGFSISKFLSGIPPRTQGATPHIPPVFTSIVQVLEWVSHTQTHTHTYNTLICLINPIDSTHNTDRSDRWIDPKSFLTAVTPSLRTKTVPTPKRETRVLRCSFSSSIGSYLRVHSSFAKLGSLVAESRLVVAREPRHSRSPKHSSASSAASLISLVAHKCCLL